MSRFRPIDRDTDYLLPPSIQDWVPESHLARYIVDVVDGLDLSELERAYGGRGSTAYHPALLLSLLIYGYATATFSSRRIERATYDSLAFRFIACDQHPDRQAAIRICHAYWRDWPSGSTINTPESGYCQTLPAVLHAATHACYQRGER